MLNIIAQRLSALPPLVAEALFGEGNPFRPFH
jgi:hypothetical protein